MITKSCQDPESEQEKPLFASTSPDGCEHLQPGQPTELAQVSNYSSPVSELTDVHHSSTLWERRIRGSAMTNSSSYASNADCYNNGRHPMTLTWIGGGDNLASDRTDWSPALTPRPGDTLLIGSGTINVSDNALAGDTLSTLPTGNTIDIVTGPAAKLNLAVGPNITTDITVQNTLTLNVSDTGEGRLNVSGGPIRFIGTNNFQGEQIFNDSLRGTATFNLYGAQGEGDLTEVNGSVGSGLTFKLSGISQLQIDQPHKFHGLVDLSNPFIINDVTFAGLHATSAELLNGILQLFDGNKLVDTTRVATASSGVRLHQTDTGVILSAGYVSEAPPGSALIPLQT